MPNAMCASTRFAPVDRRRVCSSSGDSSTTKAFACSSMRWLVVLERSLIVGDGPLESDLRRQVAALGLDARVKFFGRVLDRDLPASLPRHATCSMLRRWQRPKHEARPGRGHGGVTPVVSTNSANRCSLGQSRRRHRSRSCRPTMRVALARALTEPPRPVPCDERLAKTVRRRAEALFSREQTGRNIQALWSKRLWKRRSCSRSAGSAGRS